MEFERQSGLFVHITSLPGPGGVGTLGRPARRFVDVLQRAGQRLWQFCPTGPTTTEQDNSPYSALSAFAGTPLLVDLPDLRDRGWLDPSALTDRPSVPADRVDYHAVSAFKHDRLRRAYEGFRDHAGAAERAAFEAFRRRNSVWLEEYVLFVALRDRFDGRSWTEWPGPLRDRETEAMEGAREELADELAFRRFCQFCFDSQWTALREYADERGVALVGDVPIYVAGDSADVWANREAFRVDETGRPTHVAGVPGAEGEPFPGQRWGMPVYDWDHLRRTGFEWWVRRFERVFEQVDLARIDHFRGLESYWAIPEAEPDPDAGSWEDVPSDAFFDTLLAELDAFPVFAEDIGHITPAVEELRQRYDIPTLKLLPFADWCDDEHPHRPDNYPENAVAYTSTHDSDTARGTYADLPPEQRECLESYVERAGIAAPTDRDHATHSPREDVHWTLAETVWESDAALVFAQLQDVLGLGSEARFNVPGTAKDNWTWRITEEQLTDPSVTDRLATITDEHGR